MSLSSRGRSDELAGSELGRCFYRSNVSNNFYFQEDRLTSTVIALYPFMFTLADILCPSNVQPLGPMAFAASRFSIPMILSFGRGSPTLGRPLPPRPDQVRDRLIAQRSKSIEISRESGAPIKFPDIPQISTDIPPELASLIDGPSHRGPSELPKISHWRATFISMNPTDQLGDPVDRNPKAPAQ
jgi:hypothetical protein